MVWSYPKWHRRSPGISHHSRRLVTTARVTVNIETTKTMVETMDRLLQDGWFLITWPKLRDWPDRWALARDWKPTNPARAPADPMYRMEFCATVVRDVVGFWSNGTAVVRRVNLADGDAEWSHSGSAIESADRAIALGPSDDCCRAAAYSEQPWGALPTRVLAHFRARDWQLDDADHGGGGCFRYTRGVGSPALDRPRFYQGQTLEPLGVVPLMCDVSAELELRLIGWRVQTGCVAHRGISATIWFDDPDLEASLDGFESAATTADLTALAYRLVYGDCSKHELDLSKEYPPDEDDAFTRVDTEPSD